MDFFFEQSKSFYAYLIVSLVWIIHIIASAYRLLTLFGSSDMRLNVRFVEKGIRPVINKKKICIQIFFSILMIVVSIVTLFYV